LKKTVDGALAGSGEGGETKVRVKTIEPPKMHKASMKITALLVSFIEHFSPSCPSSQHALLYEHLATTLPIKVALLHLAGAEYNLPAWGIPNINEISGKPREFLCLGR
jgi:hypothetical protein